MKNWKIFYFYSVIMIAVFGFSCTSNNSDTISKEKNQAPKPKTFETDIIMENGIFGTSQVMLNQDSIILLFGTFDNILPKAKNNFLEDLANAPLEKKTALLMRVNQRGEIIWTKFFPEKNGLASGFISTVLGDSNTYYVIKNIYVNGFDQRGYYILHLNDKGEELERWSFYYNRSYKAMKLLKLEDGDLLVTGEYAGLPGNDKVKISGNDSNPSDALVFRPPSFTNTFIEKIGKDGKVKWKKELSNYYFNEGLIKINDKLIIAAQPCAGRDGKDKNVELIAFDNKTGKQAWKTKLEVLNQSPIPLSSFADSLIGVFLLDKENRPVTHFYRYSSTGKLLSDTMLSKLSSFWITSVSEVRKGAVFIGVNSNEQKVIYGLINKNGSIEWLKDLNNKDILRPNCFASSDNHLLFWMERFHNHKIRTNLIVADENGHYEKPDSSSATGYNHE